MDYHGASRVLAALFRRNLWRFQSYETLAERLSSLRWELGRPTAAAAAAQNWPEPCLRLIRDLSQSVLGQDQAVEAAAFRLYSHLEKRKPARPLSLVFYGPTGVGKSELGKALAPALERCRGERYQSVWTELNTFTQPHSVHRLTGAPPGYVGYEDQPILEAVRRNPRTVFMFDELEKAHPEVLKVFMSILDEGAAPPTGQMSRGIGSWTSGAVSLSSQRTRTSPLWRAPPGLFLPGRGRSSTRKKGRHTSGAGGAAVSGK